MKCFTSYTRHNLCDTAMGYKIVLTQTYTTFDKKEADRLEDMLRNMIGSCLMSELHAFEEGSEKE